MHFLFYTADHSQVAELQGLHSIVVYVNDTLHSPCEQALHLSFNVNDSPWSSETGWPVSYTHLTLPTTRLRCRSRWSPYH